MFFCVSDDESSDAIACLYFKPVGEGHIEVCGLNGHQFALTRFTHDDLSARLPEDGVLIQRKYCLLYTSAWRFLCGMPSSWLPGEEGKPAPPENVSAQKRAETARKLPVLQGMSPAAPGSGQ